MTSVTSRQFNQHTSAAKRAADSDIVFITDRGRPSHVLMSFEAYERLRGRGSLYDALAMQDAQDVDFEPHRVDFTARIPDLG